MSIGVQSYPELYTMLLGWDLYDRVWDLLAGTGIAFLPFFGLILRNISESYATHHESGQLSLRSMEIRFISMLLLIVFAVAPCIPVSARAISYTSVCSSDQQFFPGETGTTYDQAFSIPDHDIRVPMWWYLVISVAEGLTHAANTFVSCTPSPRKMVTEVDMAQISDTEVRQEVHDFASMCYIPARIAFNQDKKINNASHLERVEKNIEKYGVEDTEWLGSHGFTEVYYPDINATRPVPGFPWQTEDDINADEEKDSPPVYGMPSCADWWSDSENGLQERLYQALPKSFYDEFRDYLHDTETRDDVIKRILSHEASIANANNTLSNYGYAHFAEVLGVWVHQLEEYPKLYAASQAAPILQALLLLLIYAFLPFALVFSSYRAATCVTGAIVIFSVIFWGFIWHLVSWTDTVLMQALYSNWFERQGAGATLADMLIAGLIISAPLFWFVFMSVMGVAIGDVAGMVAAGINRTIGSAGGKLASTVRSIKKLL